MACTKIATFRQFILSRLEGDLHKKLISRVVCLRVSENPVVRTLVHLNYNNSVAIASEYGLDNYMMDVKCTVWQSFSRSLLYV